MSKKKQVTDYYQIEPERHTRVTTFLDEEGEKRWYCISCVSRGCTNRLVEGHHIWEFQTPPKK